MRIRRRAARLQASRRGASIGVSIQRTPGVCGGTAYLSPSLLAYFIAADNLSARISADGLTNSSPRIE